MNEIPAFCRALVIFIAISFLFGQMFFATFEWHATLIGISGLGVGILSGKWLSASSSRPKIITGLCILSLLGIGFDAYNYYTNLNIPGNYYGWFVVVPYCICLAYIVIKSSQINIGKNI